MKKIVLFVFMIIASVNVFSNDIPDDIYYYFQKSYIFYEKVSEDFRHNDSIFELADGYYLGSFDDDVYGRFVYKIKSTDERETLFFYNNEYTYFFVHSYMKSASGRILLFCNICVLDKEDKPVYEGGYYSEDGNAIFDYHYDYTTSSYYRNVNN